MVDPGTAIFGIPIIVILWVLIKCNIEVDATDIDDDWKASKLFWKCVIDDLVPKGLPDPDRFADYNDDDSK